MPKFGRKSLERLNELHPKLQSILGDAIEIYDFSILCGYRGRFDQDEAYRTGKSTLKFPQSKHNRLPSRAVDIAPYPIVWDDISRFKELSGIIKGIAYMRGVKVVWGGDWDRFKDYPHFQLGEDE